MNAYALTPVEQKQIALLHAHLQAGGALVSPFAREIFLIETQVAGTSYVPIKEIEKSLEPGCPLILRREPGNPHDALAILILDEKGQKLGYVPRANNEILARLMDAGKFLFARMETKTWYGDWLRVTAMIFLRDL